MREEGNSHQSRRELLRRGTQAVRDQAEGRTGREPRRGEQGENHPDRLFLSRRKLSLERRKLFPARAVSETEANGDGCATRLG